MTLRPLLYVAMLLTLAPVCLSQELGPRHRESEGFSFRPPAGWRARQTPGRKYKEIFGPRTKGFAPNIFMGVDYFEGSIDQYVDHNLWTLHRLERPGAVGYKLLTRSAFTTLSGQRGIRVITQSELVGRLFRQTLYAFDLKAGKKLLITFTVAADGGQAYDSVFEESMRTLELGRPGTPTKRLQRTGIKMSL